MKLCDEQQQHKVNIINRNKAFGNPSKLMAFQIKAVEELGMLPSEKTAAGQYNFSKRIEWFLKLEVILAKIIDLASRSTKLAHEAFSSATYKKLWSRFPTHVVDKLVKIKGDDDVRMKGILEKIVEMREHAQLMEDECGTVSSKKTPEPVLSPKVTADIFFNPPQRFDECRICLNIATTNPACPELFENHLSNYPTGCPKFIEATVNERKPMILKPKFCKMCLNPDVIYSKEHLKECKVIQKKNKYSCQNKKCMDHMWICSIHKHENKSCMEKFSKELQKKGLSLAFLSAHNIGPKKSQQLEKAIERLKKSEKAELVPVPEGEPLFLFHATQGKTEPIKTFYDSGCSHAVFKEGIPGKQLKAQIVTRGPFEIGGIGGLKSTANNEWLVSVPRVDGKSQAIQGLSVKRITSDFPMVQLKSAIDDLKKDDPQNTVLQNCRAPPIIGGCVDMLLGIKYKNIFPEEIHTLPNGLTLYKSKLASHNDLFDACIGGPHSSFNALADAAGGTARLVAHFMDGLKTWRLMGAPKIKRMNMTKEEIKFAEDFNVAEGELCQIRMEENVSEDLLGNFPE